MWFRGALALVTLAGCDVLFGLEHISPSSDAHMPDAGPETVTAHAYSRVVSNDATHSPVINIVEVSRVWRVQLADGTDVPITLAPDNTLSFIHPIGQRYRMFADAGALRVEYQFSGSHLELGYPYWGRQDRDVPAVNTKLQYSITNAGGVVGTGYVNTTGVYTTSSVGAAATVTIDWTIPNSFFGTNGLIRADRFDQAYYVVDQTLASYAATTGYRVDNIMMPQGVTTPVSGMYAPLARSTCIHVTAPMKTEASRLAGILGVDGSTYSASWYIKAIPAVDAGPDVGFLVASHGLGAGFIANEELDVMVGNPYTGHELVVGQTVQGPRSIQLGANTPTPLYSGITTYSRPAGLCPTPTTAPTDTAVPYAFSVSGVPIATDNQPITIDRSTTVPITWQVSGGRVGHYEVQLRVVGAAAGKTTTTPTVDGWSDVGVFQIDPTRLAAGSTYVIYVFNEAAFTGADFKTITYPWAQAFVASTTFTIVN